MSNAVQQITYVGEAKLFADEINRCDEGIFCLLLLGANESSDISPEPFDPDKNTEVEKIVLDALEQAGATALYSDILVKEENLSIPQICPSYFGGLLNTGIIIQSPIFVKNNERLRLQYNPSIKICHSHSYLRQIEQAHKIIHIPEQLYCISISPETILDIKDDIKILND